MAEAFEVANSGRPGPVLVDIPKDIQVALGDLEPHFSTVETTMRFRMRKLKRPVRCWRRRNSRCCTSAVA
jgi:acetolactate synthase-1/2/3 large subunit